MRGQGTFFDGETAGRHRVEVALSQDRQALTISGLTLPADLHWPLADLRALSDHAQDGQLVVTRHMITGDEAPRDPARLVLRDPALVGWLLETRPSLRKSDLHPGTGRHILRKAALAVGAIALMLLVILPAMAGTLARLIPMEAEIRFGRAVTAQMERFLGASEPGALLCDGDAGQAALDRMLTRLTDGQDIGYDLDIRVFDHPMLNAFAAPGGHVVLVRGLIDKAETPEAVAAVIAHEIGHVVNRDPTRNALRVAGSAGILSLLLGDVAGGAVLVAVGDRLLNSAYSREAERNADAYALRMLNAAGISSEGFGDFFDRLAGAEAGPALPEYLSTHPLSAERAEQARRNAAGRNTAGPVLSAVEWRALRRICD